MHAIPMLPKVLAHRAVSSGDPAIHHSRHPGADHHPDNHPGTDHHPGTSIPPARELPARGTARKGIRQAIRQPVTIPPGNPPVPQELPATIPSHHHPASGSGRQPSPVQPAPRRPARTWPKQRVMLCTPSRVCGWHAARGEPGIQSACDRRVPTFLCCWSADASSRSHFP